MNADEGQTHYVGDTCLGGHAADSTFSDKPRIGPMNADGETGRLEVRDDGSGTWECLAYSSGSSRMVARAVNDTKDELRRLAACWNACEGLPTEVLEQASNGIKPLAVSSPGWLTFLARNREELTSAQEALRKRDAVSETLRSWDEALRHVDRHYAEMRAGKHSCYCEFTRYEELESFFTAKLSTTEEALRVTREMLTAIETWKQSPDEIQKMARAALAKSILDGEIRL